MNKFIIIIITACITFFFLLDSFYERYLMNESILPEKFTICSKFKLPNYIPKKYEKIINKLLNLGHQIDKESEDDDKMINTLLDTKFIN